MNKKKAATKCATSLLNVLTFNYLRSLLCARLESNQHVLIRTLGPQPSASTNSATCA